MTLSAPVARQEGDGPADDGRQGRQQGPAVAPSKSALILPTCPLRARCRSDDLPIASPPGGGARNRLGGDVPEPVDVDDVGQAIEIDGMEDVHDVDGHSCKRART